MKHHARSGILARTKLGAFGRSKAVRDNLLSYRMGVSADVNKKFNSFGFGQPHQGTGLMSPPHVPTVASPLSWTAGGLLQRAPHPPTAPSLQVGLSAHKAGKFEDAERAYRALLAAQPEHAEAWNYLGMLHCQTSRVDEGLQCLDKSLMINPGLAVAHSNRGLALMDLGRYEEASRDLCEARRIDPSAVPIAINLSNLYLTVGDASGALEVLDGVQTAGVNQIKLLRLRAAALQAIGRTPEALRTYQQALELGAELVGNVDVCSVLSNMASIAIEQRAFARAASLLDRLISVDANFDFAIGMRCACAMASGDWSTVERLKPTIEQRTFAGARAVTPFTLLNLVDDPSAALASAKTMAARFKVMGAPLCEKGSSYAHSRIRLGYVSADLHDHATAHLMVGLFELHNRDRFDVYVYSHGPDDGSAVRARIVAAAEHFVCVDRALSDRAFAERIRADEIDLLIDLKGYTEDGRPGVFAHRPAPVQISYLGYPGTLGAPWMDVIIADQFVIPPDQHQNYSETVVYLPRCYQVTDNRRNVAKRVPARSEVGLPDDAFVFCCFNTPTKITPIIWAIWMRIMESVPGSVLWLFEGAPEVVEHLHTAADDAGIGRSRVVFAKRLGQADHLARHALADLFLDTAPYGAHTGASDALWSGLPVLTCPGTSFQSRVAGSILHEARLDDLISKTWDEYAERAIGLATSPAIMGRLRLRMQAIRSSSLFDTEGFTRDFEDTLLALRSHLRR